MIRRAWRWFLAWTRIDLDLVCELSREKGYVDFHDYPDSVEGEPWHFIALTCKRCGKQFTI